MENAFLLHFDYIGVFFFYKTPIIGAPMKMQASPHRVGRVKPKRPYLPFSEFVLSSLSDLCARRLRAVIARQCGSGREMGWRLVAASAALFIVLFVVINDAGTQVGDDKSLASVVPRSDCCSLTYACPCLAENAEDLGCYVSTM